MRKKEPKSLVSLVGAGPGDPELITVKGLRRLKQADVVIYDALVNREILDHTKPDALLIDAGKRSGIQRMSQVDINGLLIHHAGTGKRVVRLKGGDPLVFGRGGEEVEALQAAGVPYEIVPGVSSAIAVPAYAGIPLTHRDHASSFAVVTGCRKAGENSTCQDWEALARIDTLVILMGLRNLPQITSNLVTAGCDVNTPAAVIQSGTTPQQKVVFGTLANIVERAKGLTTPATIVIGKVVACGEKLQWFETVPDGDQERVGSWLELPTRQVRRGQDLY